LECDEAVIGLPIYAVGILMLAHAFNVNARLTGPVLLFANVVATVFTSTKLDNVPLTPSVLGAAMLCIAAEVVLYLALKGKI
jgi:hypothetical protein